METQPRGRPTQFPLNVTAAQGVLINDPAPAPVTQFQNPSVQGGSVNINADGSLAYTPPAGFVGQDTFTYTITNQSGQSQATVTVTINNLACYVDNTAGGGGNGTFAAPFNTLAAAVAAAGPGNIIFVSRGDGTNNGPTRHRFWVSPIMDPRVRPTPCRSCIWAPRLWPPLWKCPRLRDLDPSAAPECCPPG